MLKIIYFAVVLIIIHNQCSQTFIFIVYAFFPITFLETAVYTMNWVDVLQMNWLYRLEEERCELYVF